MPKVKTNSGAKKRFQELITGYFFMADMSANHANLFVSVAPSLLIARLSAAPLFERMTMKTFFSSDNIKDLACR